MGTGQALSTDGIDLHEIMMHKVDLRYSTREPVSFISSSRFSIQQKHKFRYYSQSVMLLINGSFVDCSLKEEH